MAIQRRSRTPVHERALKYGELAALVVRRREELGLRQDELAELAECSARFVHAIETGKPTVRLDRLLSVLSTLGLHLEVADGASSNSVTASDRLAESYQLRADPFRAHPFRTDQHRPGQ